MSKLKYTNYTNNYIPKFVLPPETLPWYEKDFSYHLDLSKCEKFVNNIGNHFKTTKVVNFDIIHRQCCGETIPGDVYKNCQSIKEKEVSKHFGSDQKRIYASAMKTDRKDLYRKGESIIKYFKTLT